MARRVRKAQAQQIVTDQKSLRKSIVGTILPLFAKRPSIEKNLIANIYAQERYNSLSMKKYGFKNLADFYSETDIFDNLDNGYIKISRAKLLKYLLEPLIGAQDLESSFVKLNSFSPQILLQFCNAPSLLVLMRELEVVQTIKTSTAAASLAQHNVSTVMPAPITQQQLLPPQPFTSGIPNIIPNMVPAPCSGPPLPAATMPPPVLLQPTFPNNGVHPKDESYLPPLPGHPRLDLPVTAPAVVMPHRPVIKRGEQRERVIERVDEYMKEFIVFCSNQGKHLPVHIVTAELDAIISMTRLFSRRDIKAWGDFDMMYKRLTTFIKNFCWQCPFTSLYELQRTIVEFEKVPSFDALHMGPILKHPLIQDLFKVPDGLTSVPEITTYDILTTLHDFVNKSKDVWSKKLEEFMTFFADKFKKESPEYLCVRVCSFKMAIAANLKFRTSQRLIREKRESQAEHKIDEIISTEMKSLKNSLRRMSLNERDLMNKPPAAIVDGVFRLCQERFPSFIQPNLFTFIETVLRRERLRNLFTIAVYQSAYGAQQYIQEQEQIMSSSIPTNTAFTLQEELFCHVQQSELVRVIAELLKREEFPIDLSSLADIEQSLLQRYSVNTFNSFSHGPFLRFVAQDKELVKCIGGRYIGSSSYSGSSQRNRVLDFIHQIKDASDTEFVSSALKDQFSIRSVEDLSCGGIEKLISDAGTQRGTTHNSSSTPFIAYTVPLLHNEQPQGVLNKSHSPVHGLLGPQSSENAYTRLSKAPLLANLSEWMQWDLIYAPSLGPLGDFLTKQHQSRCEMPIHALCDSTGRFLKIDPNSKRMDFENAVDEFDPVCAAGHLVSMVVNETSIHLMPLQLLANCVTTKLEQIDVSGKDGLVSETFVFHCLQRIPLELCETLGKVFLDPLRKVKSVESVNSLLQLCETPSQRCFFQALGLKLGINEWINDFKEMKTSGNKLTGFTSISPPEQVVPNIEEEQFQVANEAVKPSSQLVPLSQPEVNAPKETPELNKPSHDNGRILAIREGEAKTIIDKIRQEEFGIDLHLQLTEEQLKISNKQKEREGRSLQRLSQELYSKDTHFVLELIQNADDNMYTLEASVPPTVKFVLHKDCVTVLNNEVGFSEKNIRAICDVGKSTKDPLRSGYIGQKGIGFKSVFRITNTPEIHSNNFHIRFDTTSGPIGYILPEWINVSFSDDKITPAELSKWTTRIVLPMKPESSSQSMVKKFQDIQPSLLLFLNRLRSIVIHDMESGDVKTMVRQDMGEGVTIITHNKGVDRWLVARKELKDANKYKSGVHTTELAIAFPLPEDFDSLPIARDLQSQQVFAYLPLRSYGFRFIIQGDLDLPSSREDVNEDSSWNQWLREMIPSLFVEALENIKALSQLNIVQAISLFVQFIPLDGEIHDFFKPVAGQILRLLRTSEWLPTDCAVTNTAVNEGIDFGQIIELMMTDGEPQIGLPYETHLIALKQPSRLVMVPQDLIRRYIPQSVLAASLNLYYLHSSLVSRISPDLCSHLGITTMTLDNLIDIAKSVLDSYHSNNQSNSTTDIEDDDSDGIPLSPFNHLVSWIAHWLACVYTVLEETRDISSSSLLNLKKLHIIPLMDESLVALDSVIVFFPPSSDKSDPNIKKYEKIYKRLKTIHSDLLVSGDQVVRGKVYEMLSARLGVKELNPLDILNHHIIPGFSSKMKVDENIAFLRFVKENLDQCSERLKSQIMEKLKECVHFVTANNELKSPREQCIRFSTQYKDQWDLPTLFPGVSWTLVSSKYLERNPNLQSWRSFFQTLGIKSGKLLLVERINHTITSQNKQTSLWDVSDWRRSQDSSYTVRDYYCREFDDIVGAISSVKTPSQNQLLELSRLIESCWDSEYSKCFKAEYYDGSNEVRLGEVTSSFGKSIREKAWLPAMNLDENPHPLTPMMKGADLYEHTEHITNLLDDHVPYLCFKFKSHDLLEKIRVKRAVNEATLLEHLQHWSTTQSTFVTSINHIKHVYSYLARSSRFSDAERSQHFGSEKLIFFPTQFRPPHEKVRGEFVTIHDCCWADKTTVLFSMLVEGTLPPPSLPRILGFFYSSKDEAAKSEMKHAFIQLGVEKGMKLSSLIDLLEYISLDVPRPTPKHTESFRSIAEAVIGSIYERTDQGFVMNKDKRAFFKSNIQDKEVFPTTTEKWSNLTGLFVDDDAEISKLFSRSDQVHFLDWTPNRADSHNAQSGFRALQKFVEICDIPLLGKNCCKSIVPGAIRPFDELQRLFHNIVPLIQLFCLSLEQPDKKTREYQCAMSNTLQKLQFFSTITLSCTYSVGEHSLPAIPLRDCQLQLDDSSVTIYGVVDKEGKYVDKTTLVEVLQELFKIEKDGRHATKSLRFLNNLITNEPSTEEDKMAVMKKFNLEDYSDEVTEFPTWSVELPEKYKIEEKKAADDKESEAGSDYDDEEAQPKRLQEMVDDEDGGLKAWPPRAAIDKSVTSKNTSANSTIEIAPTTKDMVTSSDIAEMRRKAGQQQETLHDQQPLEELHQERRRSQPSSKDLPTQRKADTDSHTQQHRNNSSQQKQPSSAISSGSATVRASNNENVTEQEVVQNKSVAKHSKGGTQPAGTAASKPNHDPSQSGNLEQSESRTKNPVKVSNKKSFVKSFQGDFDGIEAIEISHLMQSIPLDLTQITDENNLHQDRMMASGRWGEWFAYHVLKCCSTLPGNEDVNIVSVKWVNEDSESGLPYDIEIHTDDDSTCYIEVKSTTSSDKELVPFSWKELKFAQEKSNNYSLFRVYNALSLASAQVKWLQNLYEVLESNQSVRLYLKF